MRGKHRRLNPLTYRKILKAPTFPGGKTRDKLKEKGVLPDSPGTTAWL